jgi:hypothetical protein
LKQLKAELEHKGHKLKVKDVHDPEVSEALKEVSQLGQVSRTHASVVAVDSWCGSSTSRMTNCTA